MGMMADVNRSEYEDENEKKYQDKYQYTNAAA